MLPQRRDCFVKCFIKNEAYPLFKFPRAILARGDEFKVFIAPFVKTVEELVYSLVSRRGDFYFIKKVPVPTRPALICRVIGHAQGYVDPLTAHLDLQRYLVTDYSTFEASFKREFMDSCEFVLYRHCLHLFDHPDFDMSSLECIMQDNICMFRHYVFKLLAKRMSGEMNTSLGNGFSNLMLTKFTLSEFGCRNIRIFVEGDDCIVSYVGPMITPQTSLRLGFIVKMLYVPRPNLASFCGQIFDYRHFRVVCDPIKIILNFSWFNCVYKDRPLTWKGLARAKALSLLYQYPGCPIVQPFAFRILELTMGYAPIIDSTLTVYQKNIALEALQLDKTMYRIENSTRELMMEVYSIPISVQHAIESFIETMPYEPFTNSLIMQFTTLDMRRYYSDYVR